MRKWLGKIRNRFLLAMLAIGIVPLIALGIVFFVHSYEVMMAAHMEYGQASLEVLDEKVDEISQSLITLSRSVLATDGIQEMLEGAQGSLTLAQSRALDRLLAPIYSQSEFPYALHLIANSGAIYSYRNGGLLFSDRMTGARRVDLSREEWVADIRGNQGMETFFLYNVFTQSDEQFFSTGKLMRDLNTGEPWGVLVLILDRSMLDRMLPQKLVQTGASFALADGKGNTLTLNSGAAPNPAAAVPSNDSIAQRYSTRTRWQLQYVMDRRLVLLDNLNIVYLTLAAVLILAGLCVGVSIWVANTITRPLNDLRRAIEEMDSTGTIRTRRFTDDEVGQIGRRFVKMADRIDALHQNLVELSVKEKESELRALQTQVNPHFLYNTLTSIYWLSKLNRSEDAAQTAILLSDVFKYSLDREKQSLIFVDKELIHIERYLQLQNIRFDGKIHITWDIDHEIRQLKMLKLLLQPLVENAIYHGLEPSVREWKLLIRGKLVGDAIEFTVQDNGVGMEMEEINSGFGASNVERRIQLYYGEDYGCTYESRLGEGTTVTIRIPVRREGEDA